MQVLAFINRKYPTASYVFSHANLKSRTILKCNYTNENATNYTKPTFKPLGFHTRRSLSTQEAKCVRPLPL